LLGFGSLENEILNFNCDIKTSVKEVMDLQS
jgi:hypothetical protein